MLKRADIYFFQYKWLHYLSNIRSKWGKHFLPYPRSRIGFHLFLVLLSGCWTSAAYAGWTKAEGELFFANTLSMYRSDTFVDNDGRREKQSAFHKYEWNSYAEYGWHEDITLGVNAFFQELQTEVPAYDGARTTNVGLGDTELFLRKRLWHNERASISLQPLLKLPAWYKHAGSPHSGTSDFDAELRLQGGYNFTLNGKHHYAIAETGYRKRLGAWQDQLKTDFTLGWQMSGTTTLLPQLFVTQRVNGDGRGIQELSEISDYDLIKSQFSIVYTLNAKTRLQLGIFKDIYARNTGAGEGMLIGLWHSF